MFSCKFAAYFQNTFPKNNFGGLLLSVFLILYPDIKNWQQILSFEAFYEKNNLIISEEWNLKNKKIMLEMHLIY